MQSQTFQRFWIFSIAAGLAIGNLYIAQPLLIDISKSLSVGTGQVGLLATLIQIGYAAGTILLSPLGDILPRKKLVPLFMSIAGLGLMAAGISEIYFLLALALTAIGFTTISGQMLIALTGDISDPEHRGKNLGVVVSGIVTGILISRTLSGAIEGLLGWHGSFLVFGSMNILVGLVLYRLIPVLPSKPKVSYLKLIGDVFVIPARNWTLSLNLLMNATGFAMFSALWTSMTFLLSEKPFGFNATTIGLFGLVGVIGAMVAQPVGRLYDKGKADVALVLAFIGYLVSYILGSFVFTSIAFLIAQLLLLDAAGQVNNLMNQSRILSKYAHARARVNASYVASNFVGGAVGTWAAATLWPVGGWLLIQHISIVLSAVLLIGWMILGKTKIIENSKVR